MTDKIIASVNKVKKIKVWKADNNVITINFAKVLYFEDDEAINNQIRKYKKIAESRHIEIQP